MIMKKINALYVMLFFTLLFTQTLFAQTTQELEREADIAIEKFKQEIEGGEKFLTKIKGYLLFPSIMKGGLVIGGKYGKGVLRIKGKTKAYLSMSAASIGLQAGVQQHAMLIAFITESALKSFYKSSGWEVGVDSTLSISQWGISRDINSLSFEKPVVAFIFAEKGIMAGIGISGIKFKQIRPQRPQP